MPGQEKIDINIPIEARIKNAQGIKLGDDEINPLERKLYEDIVAEHGTIISDTRESMNQNFLSLIEDVADLSEGNQRQLREVAEMLDVTLKTKDDALQMNYELFQKILIFQRDNKMKLTGIVDDALHQALKEEMWTQWEEKKEDPTTATVTAQATAVQKEATPQTETDSEAIPPPPVPGTPWSETKREIQQPIPLSTYPVDIQASGPIIPVPSTPATTDSSYNERILPPTPPANNTTTSNTVSNAPAEKTPIIAVPIPATETPAIRALPVEEAAVKTEEVKQVITEEAKKLWITINGLEISESPLGEEIVEMILYYEWGGGSRKPDVGRFDIWGGIQTGSSREETVYALWGEENYTAWSSTFIPKDKVKECVLRLLNVRIALTQKSCAEKWINFDALPQNVKGVLVDLHYNMPNNINQFSLFWKAIQEKNWQEAGKQLVDNGRGGPSDYLSQVSGRAYANAMMLANGDSDFQSYKEWAGSGAQNIYNTFIQNTGKYQKKVGMWERKEIVQNAQSVAELLATTTSNDVLNTVWSTKSIIRILDKYLPKDPAERKQIKEEMIQALKNQIGNYSRPLITAGEIGAFQQLVYLEDPQRFKKELVYIDGEGGEGSRTQKIFMQNKSDTTNQ